MGEGIRDIHDMDLSLHSLSSLENSPYVIMDSVSPVPQAIPLPAPVPTPAIAWQ